MRTRDRQRARGECLLWGLASGFMGLLLFGWGGIACGVLVAGCHYALQARGDRVHASIPGIWHLGVLPATLAITLAALPIDAWILFAPPLLLLWLATSLPIRPRLPARALGALVMVGTLWLCARLPVKHMDGVVGPAEYRSLTLQALSDRLYEDHGIICDVTSGDIENRIVDFTIPSPMCRRKVMHKLADDTHLRLHIGGCGNGASLLWGTGPGIAYLFEPEFP